MGTDFFGYSAWILAEITCNFLERSTGIQLAFNVKPVCSGKMLMVSWNIFTHDVSFHCCQGHRHHKACAGLNSTCAQINSIEETKGRIYFCNLGRTNFRNICLLFLKIYDRLNITIQNPTERTCHYGVCFATAASSDAWQPIYSQKQPLYEADASSKLTFCSYMRRRLYSSRLTNKINSFLHASMKNLSILF